MSSSVDEFGITDEFILIYTYIIFIVCQALNIFGIATNATNIICFARQGFEDSVNVSLLGLAVSDLGSLITMIFVCISLHLTIMKADVPFESIEVAYLTVGIPHFSFTRVSSCITAMITLERCLCITTPLKVKSLITTKRATATTVVLFIIFYFTSTPVYVINKMDMKFSTKRNITLFGLVSTSNREQVEMFSFTINNFAIPFVAFILIVVCTGILSFILKNRAKFRQTLLSTKTQADRVSKRNHKAAKMIVMISTLFICSFIPANVNMLAIALFPELAFDGKYVNISIIISAFGFVMESINSSMNIFIYYHMSSKYREVFWKVFHSHPRTD